MTKLEVCCYSVECALAAESAGADRIELCASFAEGGITPSFGTLRQARAQLSTPVHPLVRPRGGDFCYSQSEFLALKEDIACIRDLGFPGIAVGVLDKEGHIDLLRMKEIMALCDGMSVTFHRAFDMCFNPQLALQQLTQLGVARILTSGQQQSAEIGLPLLRELTRQSQGPVIMAGGGVRLTNLKKFIDSGLHELHTSARRYRKAGVTLNADNDADEFTHYCVDSDIVAAMKTVMQYQHVLQHPASTVAGS